MKECNRCNGSGSIRELVCKKCGDMRVEKCWACGGSGKLEENVEAVESYRDYGDWICLMNLRAMLKDFGDRFGDEYWVNRILKTALHFGDEGLSHFRVVGRKTEVFKRIMEIINSVDIPKEGKLDLIEEQACEESTLDSMWEAR